MYLSKYRVNQRVITFTDGKWPYNFNYWTSARRIIANETFQWCLLDQNIQFSNNSKMWAAGQPDNKNKTQNCIHLAIPKNKTSIELTDRNCSDKFVFGCKV
jgi:hypothetical protein